MPAAEISDADRTWSERGALWTERVAQALEPALSRPVLVEHIGSTAVPGLAAKAVLDLQVLTPDLPDLAAVADAVEHLGLRPTTGSRPDSPGVTSDTPRPGAPTDAVLYRKHLLYRPGTEDDLPVVLHVRRLDSPFARYVRDFRDWLRAVPSEAAAYEAVKRALADAHAGDDDYDDYTRAKTAFLDAAQGRLEAWVLATRGTGDAAGT